MLFRSGCGSGRYSIALARVGAMKVVGVDYDKESFHEGRRLVKKLKLPVKFRAANVLALPFKDNSFDFIFCNGVLHHTHSIQRGLKEMHRVLKPNGCAFLYLYAAGGAFWETRTAMRKLFKRIPIEYTERVLKMIGMPPNRFIFCDTWYVPVETLTRKADLERMLAAVDFRFEKIVSRNAFDLDAALKKGIRGAAEMWGDGEHRYILFKSSEKAQYRESLWPK